MLNVGHSTTGVHYSRDTLDFCLQTGWQLYRRHFPIGVCLCFFRNRSVEGCLLDSCFMDSQCRMTVYLQFRVIHVHSC